MSLGTPVALNVNHWRALKKEEWQKEKERDAITADMIMLYTHLSMRTYLGPLLFLIKGNHNNYRLKSKLCIFRKKKKKL